MLEQSGAVALFQVDEYRGNPMAEIGAAAVDGLGAVREVCDMNDAAALHAVAGSAAEQALPDVSPGCCSAYRLDADRHSNVLIRFDSEGSNDHAEQHAKGLEWPFVVPVNTMTRGEEDGKPPSPIAQAAASTVRCWAWSQADTRRPATTRGPSSIGSGFAYGMLPPRGRGRGSSSSCRGLDVAAASTAWISLVDLEHFSSLQDQCGPNVAHLPLSPSPKGGGGT